jgi:hypothetical protein
MRLCQDLCRKGDGCFIDHPEAIWRTAVVTLECRTSVSSSEQDGIVDTQTMGVNPMAPFLSSFVDRSLRSQ